MSGAFTCCAIIFERHKETGDEDAVFHARGRIDDAAWACDAVDVKIIPDVAEGCGHIVDSEAQSSGYPAYAPTRRVVDPAEWNLADLSPRAGWSSLFR